MLWILLAVLVIVGGVMLRRRPSPSFENEPWRASLDADDDGELDMNAIRQAEDEWLSDAGWSAADDWEDGSATEDSWR